MDLREAIEKLTMWHQANPRTGPLGVVMNAVADGTLIPADQCYEVREGYRVQAQFLKTIYEDAGVWVDRPLSEALEIRSADDLRREVLEMAARLAINTNNGETAKSIYRAILALIDTPQPKGGDDE